MMAKIQDKFVESKKSFLELGKQLQCETCKEIAYNPHVLGECDHTFCQLCINLHSSKACPICGILSECDACRDLKMENLLKAYLLMAKFLGIDVKDNKNDVKMNGHGTSNISITPSAATKYSKTQKSTVDTDEFASPAHMIKKHDRKVSLNESLNSSISGTPASKLNKRNQKGETQLHVACLKQDIHKVKELLGLGVNTNTQDNAGWTPLHEVVSSGNEAIVALLLENGANPNIPGGHNETPLHDAVACNRTTIARLLVSNGADVNARNSRGLTPKDIYSKDNEEMKVALESSKTASTPIYTERTTSRTSLQTLQLYVLNPEKKSQPRLSKLARTFSFKLASTYSSQVTHVCVRLDDPPITIKTNPHFYSAVLQGQFIVDFKWIEESEKVERLTDPCVYEIDGTLNRAPSDGSPSRLNVANQLPGLFNNCLFYLNGIFSTPSKADITQWIRHGGGTVLTRSPNPENISSEKIPYHAAPKSPLAQCSHFIIYDRKAKTHPSLKYNMSHVKTLSVDWLLACIENFLLVDPFDF